ncbi:MAG: folylpolyglutamate synthase/dihydrofolate synthase family protein [Planctomycetota bacterium]
MSLPHSPASPTDSAARRDAAVAWLMGRINYERVAHFPYSERQLKLDRIRQLLQRLGSPDASLRIVHVAGSKGKGSTSALIASVLTAAGLKTGVYSSPHLERIEERWAIDGSSMATDSLASLVDRIKPVVHAMDAEAQRDPDSVGPPTFFDITTAMALVHFADQRCDAVVLEVGLGGRLDSTNVCLPVVSVITSISLDHTKQLGDTLGAIAREKAGIVKPGVPVVSGVTDPEPRGVIAEIARERGCRLMERTEQFDIEAKPPLAFWRETPAGRETIDAIEIGLRGRHQQANAAVAIATVLELRDQGWPITAQACRDGLALARLPARVEWFPPTSERPALVIDTAHNGASAEALVDSLGEPPSPKPKTLVVAISRDKQVDAIVGAFASKFDRVVVTRFVENSRALAPDELAGRFEAVCRAVTPIEVIEDPVAAFHHAVQTTPAEGLVVVTGSFFIAAELRPIVAGETP